MTRALLVGKEPMGLGFAYVAEPPYEAVVIGSLTLGQLLHFSDERVLSALSEGKPVYLYSPGLPCVAEFNTIVPLFCAEFWVVFLTIAIWGLYVRSAVTTSYSTFTM